MGNDAQEYAITLITKNTGIDFRSNGERELGDTFRRLLGFSLSDRKARYTGSKVATMVENLAKLMFPGDAEKAKAEGEKIMDIFVQMSDVDGATSSSSYYDKFVRMAGYGQSGWDEQRAAAYKAFVVFASEVKAMKAYADKAQEAGFLMSSDRLYASLNTWDENVTKFAKLLRDKGKFGREKEIPFTSGIVMPEIIQDAVPFAARPKPGPQAIGQAVIAEESAPAIDLTPLKELLKDPDFRDGDRLKHLFKHIGVFKEEGLDDIEILGAGEARKQAARIDGALAAVRKEIGKLGNVSRGEPNLGPLTTELTKVIGFIIEADDAIRAKLTEFDYPPKKKEKIINQEENILDISVRKLEIFLGKLEEQKKLFSASRAVA